MNETHIAEILALASALLERIGQEFDGECRLTEEQARAIAAAFDELLGEVERLEKRAKDQTIALTGLTCGGSEFFVRDGEKFYADIDACVNYVREAKANQHREIVKRVGLQKAAGAKLAAAVGALKRQDCPRPCNGRPDGFSVGQCNAALECGCMTPEEQSLLSELES